MSAGATIGEFDLNRLQAAEELHPVELELLKITLGEEAFGRWVIGLEAVAEMKLIGGCDIPNPPHDTFAELSDDGSDGSWPVMGVDRKIAGFVMSSNEDVANAENQ